jgi:multidrug transporter EmrE-like cation transporter
MAAGVLFSLLAAILLNTGNVVQKHAVTSMPEFSARRSNHLVRTLAGSRVWLLGLTLCLVGLAFQIIAFSLAPISVVQSVFNAGIVLLIVLSRLRLGERLQGVEWAGIAVVVLSLTAISVSLRGGTGSIGVSGSGLRVLIAGFPTLLVVGVIVAVILSRRFTAGYLYGITAGLLYGVAALGTKGASTLVVRHGVWHSIPPMLTSAYPYVFLFCSALGMLIYQTGLQRYRISVVGTMSDVICSTYVVAVGMIVFGESLPRDAVTLTLRLGGFAGVLLGTVLVAGGGRHEGTRVMPPTESDLGLGPVLVAEIDSLTGHAIDDIVGG